MHGSRVAFLRLLAFVILLALLATSCSEQLGSLSARLAANAPGSSPGQAALTSTPDATAQTALEAAAAALQDAPTEQGVAAASGGAPVLTEGPSALVSPQAGGANTWVTVTGSGFPANVQVNLYLAGLVSIRSSAASAHVYATATTDRDGNYTLAFPMPSIWPDGTLIEPGPLAILVAAEDFSTRANATFEYRTSAPGPSPTPLATSTATPSPTATPPPVATPIPGRNPYVEVTPLSGSAFTQVTLRGGGFPARSTLTVYLGVFDAQIGGGEPLRYGSTRTDDGGNFALSFTMPAAWPDNTRVEPGPVLILVATENFTYQASAVFTYNAPTSTPPANPSAQVQPRSGGANTQVTVSGGGFPPNTRVDLYLSGLVSLRAAGAAPNSYATTVTDGAGQYRMTFVMPSTWPDGQPIESGTLALLVATQDLGGRASATFDYLAATPTAVSPQSWRGSYYANPDQRNEPVLVRNDAEIRFFWGGGSPDPLLPSDGFSVSWQRTVQFDPGYYRFTVEVDDGARLFVDGTLLLESWRRGERRTLSIDYRLDGGAHTVRLDYFEDVGEALVVLRWQRLADAVVTPVRTPGAPGSRVLFGDHPWNNLRGVNQTFCSGFESECGFAGCVRNYRLVWGPYCREGDYPYIQPGLYRVTFYGTGRVRAGATDYGSTQQLFAFGIHELDLPGSFTFCWPGRQSNGYGFETIAQSTGTYASVDWITVEYLGERCS